MAKETTISRCDWIECPECEELIPNVWQYYPGVPDLHNHDAEIECPWCNLPLTLCREVFVSFECKAGHKPPDPAKSED